MATARKNTARRPKPAVVECPDCHGSGETDETVCVGPRGRRKTGDKQTAVCLTCFGAGQTATT
ncbi:hypothetical protein ACIO7M_05320 [Streptomyces toxytricini]|uniref:Molecular chaperone DnaJ n=1 Tax=Streptomyces toxytricini TaxID=67369 RepID=A0ABW8EEV8_STRT5